MTVRAYACILGSTLVITTLKMIEGSALVVTLDEDLILFLILTFLSKKILFTDFDFFQQKNRRRKNGDFLPLTQKINC